MEYRALHMIYMEDQSRRTVNIVSGLSFCLAFSDFTLTFLTLQLSQAFRRRGLGSPDFCFVADGGADVGGESTYCS